MGIPDRIEREMLAHGVDLLRYDASIRRKIRAMLDTLGRDLVQDLFNSGIDTPRFAWQKSRLRALLAAAQKRVDETYGQIGDFADSEMRGLVRVTGDAVVTVVNEAIGAKLLQPVEWTGDQLAAIASDTWIHGAPSAEWWSRQASATQQALGDTLRQGMLRGETLDQLRDRILPKTDLRMVPPGARGPIWQARRNADALIRSSVVTMANAAHLAAYEANADVLGGFTWSAALDPRTCPSCGALDGRSWAFGESHPMPALHWGCRCALLPKTKSWEELARAAGGDTRLARVMDEIDPGERASLDGPVRGDLTYEGWLKEQNETRQREILGAKRFDLYQRGQISFSDLVDQSGNPLTLEQLRRRR